MTHSYNFVWDSCLGVSCKAPTQNSCMNFNSTISTVLSYLASSNDETDIQKPIAA